MAVGGRAIPLRNDRLFAESTDANRWMTNAWKGGASVRLNRRAAFAQTFYLDHRVLGPEAALIGDLPQYGFKRLRLDFVRVAT